jgi:hypothetical protein
MPERTVTVEIADAGLGEDELILLAEVLERDAGDLAPSCALHAGTLAVTITVDADTLADAVRVAADAVASALRPVQGTHLPGVILAKVAHLKDGGDA